jgi:cleavage stimulation factor subunit 3
LSPQAARPLFERFYKYECEYGDTAAIRKISKRMADLYPEGTPPSTAKLTPESNLTRFVNRHTLFGINPIAIFDLPPPLPAITISSTTVPHDDDISSVPSSRAASVQPSDLDVPKPRKLDRFGRDKGNSPNAQNVKPKTGAASKRELPLAILDFLAVLPPAVVFDGATFHIDELVRLIRDAGVPYPVGFVVKSKRGRGDDDDGDLGHRGSKKYRDD